MDNIIGHSSAKQKLIDNPHVLSWLICGKKGIGKATLAQAFAKYLTSQKETGITDANANSFDPNILNIQDNGETIGIDEIRNIKKFLYLSAIKSAIKVVIVDSIDFLTINAANAMLKILEEPPKNSVIILISHHPYNIAQVIKSRCFILNLSLLNYRQTQQIIEKNFPGLQLSSEISTLYKGSPGMVTDNINSEMSLYKNFLAIMTSDNNDKIKINEIINTDVDLYKIEYILLHLIVNIIKSMIGIKDNTEAYLSHQVNYWMERYLQAQYLISTARKFYLDKKHVMLNLIYIINFQKIL